MIQKLQTKDGKMKFKDVLVKLRKEKGLTQHELAKRARIPLGSLRGHEQGQRLPSWPSVVKVANALGVSTDEFAACDEVKESKAGKARKGK